jgi:putative glycosyl hydrolase
MLCACLVALLGCGGGSTGGNPGTGGGGGATGSAGTTGSGGTAGATAGRGGSAGSSGSAGTVGTAGTVGSAGTVGTGGTTGAGGRGGTSGAAGTGGTTGAGGRGGTSGAAGTGGTSGRGGSAGGGRGGTTGTAGTGGTGGGAAPTCKRGIAANTAPGAAFFPAVGWWYNWSLSRSGGNTGIEFVPMVWGSSTVNGTIPAGSKYLLGFNEPNFKAQSNLTAQAAAAAWPALQTNARNAGILAIVGPGLNFCGPAADCNGTDPYVYLRDFLTACTNCQVDHIAVHWYDDFASLRAYIESNASLAGWVQFGKPIWLTEFSLGGSATVAQQEAFMRQAIPYLESQPNVFRYSWFSANPIPNARLINSDGSPTALGQVYISLPGNCQ